VPGIAPKRFFTTDFCAGRGSAPGTLTVRLGLASAHRPHHDAMMRTTIDLPTDLHHVLTSLATSNRRSLSRTAVDLMRLGLQDRASTGAGAALAASVNPATGLPVVRLARVITAEDVRALDDGG
jgi:hypothetical protein